MGTVVTVVCKLHLPGSSAACFTWWTTGLLRWNLYSHVSSRQTINRGWLSDENLDSFQMIA